MGAFGDTRIPGLPGAPLSCDPRVNPTLSLSTGAGPSGTEVTVAGADFCAGEMVTISFHTEQIATADFRRHPGSPLPHCPGERA